MGRPGVVLVGDAMPGLLRLVAAGVEPGTCRHRRDRDFAKLLGPDVQGALKLIVEPKDKFDPPTEGLSTTNGFSLRPCRPQPSAPTSPSHREGSSSRRGRTTILEREDSRADAARRDTLTRLSVTFSFAIDGTGQ